MFSLFFLSLSGFDQSTSGILSVQVGVAFGSAARWANGCSAPGGFLFLLVVVEQRRLSVKKGRLRATGICVRPTQDCDFVCSACGAGEGNLACVLNVWILQPNAIKLRGN